MTVQHNTYISRSNKRNLVKILSCCSKHASSSILEVGQVFNSHRWTKLVLGSLFSFLLIIAAPALLQAEDYDYIAPPAVFISGPGSNSMQYERQLVELFGGLEHLNTGDPFVVHSNGWAPDELQKQPSLDWQQFNESQSVYKDNQNRVLIIAGGGEQELTLIQENLAQGIPVIIIEGSGSAADTFCQTLDKGQYQDQSYQGTTDDFSILNSGGSSLLDSGSSLQEYVDNGYFVQGSSNQDDAKNWEAIAQNIGNNEQSRRLVRRFPINGSPEDLARVVNDLGIGSGNEHGLPATGTYSLPTNIVAGTAARNEIANMFNSRVNNGTAGTTTRGSNTTRYFTSGDAGIDAMLRSSNANYGKMTQGQIFQDLVARNFKASLPKGTEVVRNVDFYNTAGKRVGTIDIAVIDSKGRVNMAWARTGTFQGRATKAAYAEAAKLHQLIQQGKLGRVHVRGTPRTIGGKTFAAKIKGMTIIGPKGTMNAVGGPAKAGKMGVVEISSLTKSQLRSIRSHYAKNPTPNIRPSTTTRGSSTNARGAANTNARPNTTGRTTGNSNSRALVPVNRGNGNTGNGSTSRGNTSRALTTRQNNAVQSKRLTDLALANPKAKGSSRTAFIKKASHGMSQTAGMMFSIMLLHAIAQAHQNGKVDFKAIVDHTVNSPDIWAGVATYAVARRAGSALTPNFIKARCQTAMMSAGFKGGFTRLLAGCGKWVGAMAAFEIAGGYIRAASEGIDQEDGHLTITEMFSGKGEKGKQFLRNLGKIMMDPAEHGRILKHVIKERLLTFEFGGAAIGMMVGMKAGAIAGAKICTAIGCAGGPVGAAIGFVCGVVGGAALGYICSTIGKWIDNKIAEYKYGSAIKEIEKLATNPAEKASGWRQFWNGNKSDTAYQREDIKKNIEKMTELRTKLVAQKQAKYAQIIKKLKEEKRESRRQEYVKELEGLRDEIQEYYLRELEMLDKVISHDDPALGRDQWIDLENHIFTEMILVMYQLDAATRACFEEAGVKQEQEEEEETDVPTYDGISIFGDPPNNNEPSVVESTSW